MTAQQGEPERDSPLALRAEMRAAYREMAIAKDELAAMRADRDHVLRVVDAYRGEIDRLRGEVTKSFAERDATDAALRALCSAAGNSPDDYEFISTRMLRSMGLWREPTGGESRG